MGVDVDVNVDVDIDRKFKYAPNCILVRWAQCWGRAEVGGRGGWIQLPSESTCFPLCIPCPSYFTFFSSGFPFPIFWSIPVEGSDKSWHTENHFSQSGLHLLDKCVYIYILYNNSWPLTEKRFYMSGDFISPSNPMSFFSNSAWTSIPHLSFNSRGWLILY